MTLLSDIDMHDVTGDILLAPNIYKILVYIRQKMTQYLCNIKMSGTNCITKKYRVPFFNYVLTNKIVLKYMDRPAQFKIQFFTSILGTLVIYFTYIILFNLQNNVINTCLSFLTKINFVNTVF